MAQPNQRPPARSPAPAHEAALVSAAFCMLSFAAMIWPIGRMWNRGERDWQMIAPTFALELFLAAVAIASIVRFVILRRRVDRPAKANPAKATAAAGKPARKASAVIVSMQPLIPAPARAPHDQVDVELRDPEPAAEPFVYPDVPDDLGPAFQRIMQTVRAVAEYPDIVADLDARHTEASKELEFQKAEEFVIRKAEKHPAFNPDAYAEPINPLNPALFLDQADAILPYAATVAGMVLVSDQLPERLWDLLAAPWEAVGLDFPQVVLA